MAVATPTRSRVSGTRSRRLVDDFGWERPRDWLALPEIAAGTEKVVGLVAIFDHDSNHVAFIWAAAYTVDWGDGSAPQNFAGNATASHTYDFADPDLGPLTSEGHKQAIITITPQAGQSLTGANYDTRGSIGAAQTNIFSSLWLDLRISAPQCSTFTFGTSAQVIHRLLRQFEWVGNAHANLVTVVLTNCSRLENVVGTKWTANLTSAANLFTGCVSLKTIPPLDLGKSTNFTSMFNGCSSLQSIPLIDTHLGTTFTTMFSGCSALRSIPLLDTGNGTNFTSMFSNCFTLESIPLLNTSKGTNFGGMFSGCSLLRTIPLLDVRQATVMSSMFNGCTKLETVPLLDIPAASINFGSMFNACPSLQSLPALNMANGSSFTSTFAGCTSLSKCDVRGVKLTHSYAGCRLSAAELNRIYTNLASGVSGQTITVTTNYGIAGDNPAIATAKGWTVTGS